LDGLSPADLRQMLFLYTCRATPVLADFVRQVYWQKYAAGGREIAKDDARKFILQAVRRGLTARKWSETTVTRVSNYLLGISADYGLLGSIREGSRPIIPFGITPLATCVLAPLSASIDAPCRAVAPQPSVPPHSSPLPSIRSCRSQATPCCGRWVSPCASDSDVAAFGLGRGPAGWPSSRGRALCDAAFVA
jgi:hypothetical protein